MRYVLSGLLLALVLIVAGVMLGFFTVDFSAPGGPRLTASSLAYLFCDDYDCSDGWGSGFTSGCAEGGYGCAVWERADPHVDVSSENPRYDGYYYAGGNPWGIYRPDWDDLAYYGGPSEYDGWTEEVIYEEKVSDPWYVKSFPGVGGFFQQIIPGQIFATNSNRPAPIIHPQPSCWISASPSTVAYGGATTLQWSAFNASQASLSDVGTVPTTGSRTVQNISAERIFSLSVVGPGGSGSCYARVVVQPPSSATPSCIISAHPERIGHGETTSLAWASNNASSALLSGVGEVSTRGGIYVSPSRSTTYTLTVYGSGDRSNSCTTHVSVGT